MQETGGKRDPTSGGRPGRRRRKEARPNEIVDAALALFAEKGFAATRLEEVAARAGIAKGTIYLYFDSKEALFEAVVRARVLPVLDAAGSVVTTSQWAGALEPACT